ncbi:hypothetical protein [Clostridium fungisolvens]|uniref:Prenyltransferase and squalene oxidase repeat-containing protein n=1 Tax=Clostridium fungisolvens TaxID=1604897 RepID=A0A6V8SDX8_9CLOT|nr:hypothetical protein [Clostridium fungisolvens]GFP75439.1 hypothetical protein bsdtw1_01519 [Clostridium fungisolvens]
MYYEQARNFIYRNARPLDIARWKYLFENGSKEDVLISLTAYQNEDGGFGNALEPDCWNPNSSPVQTWVATKIIKEINLEDKNHPIIQGILKYLSSGKDFDGHTWSNTLATNNDYPHAPWWNFETSQEISYNPTACFIGFILKFADKNSKLFELACSLVKEAYNYFKIHFPMDSMHTVSCFIELYEYIKKSSMNDLLDIEEFNTLLHQQIKHVITYDTSKWAVDYVCKPSLFIGTKTSDFYMNNKEISDYECEFILNTQEPDGTWAITWSWIDYPEQWNISKNWWKSDLIIRNVRYIKEIRG